jgi:hypothetical protein
VIYPGRVPTWETDPRFDAEWRRLSPAQRAAFHAARLALLACLVAGRRPDPRLGVKRLKSSDDLWELRWAADGRALWKYGPQVPGRTGPHIVWVRIGTHDIYNG